MSRRALVPLLLAPLLAASGGIADAAARPFEVRDLVTLERVGSPTLSPG